MLRITIIAILVVLPYTFADIALALTTQQLTGECEEDVPDELEAEVDVKIKGFITKGAIFYENENSLVSPIRAEFRVNDNKRCKFRSQAFVGGENNGHAHGFLKVWCFSGVIRNGDNLKVVILGGFGGTTSELVCVEETVGP